MQCESWSRRHRSIGGGVHWVDVESAQVQHHSPWQHFVLTRVLMMHERRRQARIGWRRVSQRY